MSRQPRRIADEALSLPAWEKAELVDELLSSLDRPDASIDAEWRREVEDRLKGFRNGETKAILLSEVLSKYRK